MRKPIKDKNITTMTRAEFYALPCRRFTEDIGKFDSLVILPARACNDDFEDENEFTEVVVDRMESGKNTHLHDSGLRLMDFVAVNEDNPICRLSGCSDVLHIEGTIEGNSPVEHIYHKRLWTIDCLPESGLLRLFANFAKLKVGQALSNFEVCSLEEEKTK